MRLLADENFDHEIVRGIWKRDPDVAIILIQNTEVFRADDPAILEYAAARGLVLLSHDRKTMPKFAYERVVAGKAMPGVIIVLKDTPIGQAIDELLTIIGAMPEEEINLQVTYVPI